MANQNQHNAAGMPVAFRLCIVVVSLYFFAWGFDNVVQPQNRNAPATVSAQDFVRGAVDETNAKVWQ